MPAAVYLRLIHATLVPYSFIFFTPCIALALYFLCINLNIHYDVVNSRNKVIVSVVTLNAVTVIEMVSSVPDHESFKIKNLI